MSGQKLGAIILAAGLSSRMEAFKPLRHLGEKKIVEHVVRLFQDSGIGEILTVVGHRAQELIPVVEASSSQSVVNENYRDGMFSSVQAGVEKLSQSCDAFFLLPVDIPLVQATTIDQLSKAFQQSPSALVCYPHYDQRRGHPPLINCQLAANILTYKGQGGLRGLLKKYEEQAVIVPVNDPFIHMDVDTPEDLSNLNKAYLGSRSKIEQNTDAYE